MDRLDIGIGRNASVPREAVADRIVHVLVANEAVDASECRAISGRLHRSLLHHPLNDIDCKTCRTDKERETRRDYNAGVSAPIGQDVPDGLSVTPAARRNGYARAAWRRPCLSKRP